MLLKHFRSVEKTQNGWLVHGDAADVMLVFMTDDIIRVRVSFDRRFKEESYTLVTTAWPDRMDELLAAERRRITALDIPCVETDKTLTFATATLKLVLRKRPFSMLLYTADGQLIYQDLRERAFEQDQLGRLSHYSRMDRVHDHFYGFGEKTGHLDKKGRRLRMSPKDAIGHDPESGDPMYKHIPFYVRVNDEQRYALGLFYHNSYDSVFDMGQEISGYRMLPYLYSLMYEANRDGMPAMRPLFLEFPDDPACYADENLTFMFGPAVLVANVVEKGAKTRQIYLPAGATWYDMNDHLRAYAGGQTIEVPVDLGSIPMFLRGSAVFVTSEDVKHILDDTLRRLDLIIAAESDNTFVLYDDDGHTETYKDGNYSKTEIKVTAGERTTVSFRKTGSYADTVESLTLRLVSKAKGAYWVTVDGKPVQRTIVREAFDAADCAWYYDLSDRTIWVKYQKPEKDDYDVVISTEKFDLVGMVLEKD